MALRSDGWRVEAGGGWRRRVGLVVDHLLHLLFLIDGFGTSRGFESFELCLVLNAPSSCIEWDV
jgi:hypothetical protein